MIFLEEKVLNIEGIVENIVYQNEQNGYIVFDLDAGGEMITVVGEIGSVDEGEKLHIEGNYFNNSKFGIQFRAEYCERMLPNTAVHIQKYLASGVIKGIGPSLAKKIVSVFGDRTLEIMENSPEMLLEIKGISAAKCEAISKELRQIFNLRKLMSYLSEFDIKSKFAMKAFKKWGVDSIDIIKENPYMLCSYGIELDFQKAETVAKSSGISADSPKRIKAGITYILLDNMNSGHTCMILEELENKVCSYLSIKPENFEHSYEEEINSRHLTEYISNDTRFVYLSEYYNAEKYIADRLASMLESSVDKKYDYNKFIDIQEENNGIKYETLQRKAISLALSKGLLILTGGPGTGKTTTLNAIISMYKGQGDRVMIAAPTGRAAKRISDLTGYDAKTIHRLLEVQYDMDGKLNFSHCESNTLRCDVLIIDEMSMVDVTLFESLLKAIRLNCRLVMVGDSDQLPSVGAGNVLRDMIESRRLPVIELKEIFRQAQESCIVMNAHKIIDGVYPDLTSKDNDFFFFQRLNFEEAADCVVDLVSTRLPEAYNYSSVDDIQVLCPSRKGTLGVTELNKKLQDVINPQSDHKPEIKSAVYSFRVGDKVMQTRNNYDITWEKDDESGSGIFNGDIGKILYVNYYDKTVIIDFDGRKCTYEFDLLEQLELAYAVTVHKSQGSEFNVVVLPLLGGFEKLYYRNLLYTAVTRAKKLLIIVGSKNQVFQMVDNNQRTFRYTGLKSMLESEISDEYSD